MVTFMLSPLVALQIEQLLSLKIATVAVVCLGFLPPPGTRRHHHPVATGSCDSHLVMIRYMTVELFLVDKLLVTFLTFILLLWWLMFSAHVIPHLFLRGGLILTTITFVELNWRHFVYLHMSV